MVKQGLLHRTIKMMMLLTILAGCSSRTNLEFSSWACDLDEFSPYEPPREAILSSTWESESVLLVEGYVKANCAASIRGDYRVSGDDLVLYYRARLPALGAML